MPSEVDVAVVGGGIGGLACARALAQAGLKIRVFERRARLGGRAACHAQDGFCFDQGPHALYRKGAGMQVLRGLGIRPQGHRPPTAGICLLAEGQSPLPSSALSLLRFGPASVGERLALARVFAGMGRIDPRRWDEQPVQAWLDSHRPVVARVLAMFLRLTTYAHAPTVQSAGAAIRALQAGAGGVVYLDDGWQSLIDDLSADLDICRARVDGIEGGVGDRWLETSAGRVRAKAVVVAAGPAVARRLVGLEWAGEPIRLATLSLALRRPPPVHFALGYTDPVYMSVPSQTARQAPEGAAVVHIARYLAPGQAPPGVANLEGVLDRVDPEWRDAECHRRFLPNITVSHHLACAADGGLAGRAPGSVAPDVHLVGDWVGPVGQLADASLASSDAAAQALIARLVRQAA